MQCGHCGSHVEDGFTVCKGCGANLRRRNGRIILGAILLIFGLPFCFQALGQANWSMAFGGIFWAAIGALLIRSGMTKVWFRRNA